MAATLQALEQQAAQIHEHIWLGTNTYAIIYILPSMDASKKSSLGQWSGSSGKSTCLVNRRPDRHSNQQIFVLPKRKKSGF
jgi:hypothetical protein